jgi:hypothetical protein
MRRSRDGWPIPARCRVRHNVPDDKQISVVSRAVAGGQDDDRNPWWLECDSERIQVWPTCPRPGATPLPRRADVTSDLDLRAPPGNPPYWEWPCFSRKRRTVACFSVSNNSMSMMSAHMVLWANGRNCFRKRFNSR